MSSASPAYTSKTPSSELSHASIGQWGAVIAGVLAGFAITIVLATLGSAVGLTTGLMIDLPSDEQTAQLMSGVALGWLLLSAIIVGIVGGTVLARSSRADRAFHAGMLGLVTWTGGILLAVLIATPAAAGFVSAMGANAGVASSYFIPQRNAFTESWGARPAGGNGARIDTTRTDAARTDTGRSDTGRSEAGAPRAADASASRTPPAAPLTEEERVRLRIAAEDAARAAMIAAWTALVAQLLSLLATIGAAKWQRRRLVVREPVGYAMPAHGTV